MRMVTMGVAALLALYGLSTHGAAVDGKAIYTSNCGGCHAVMPPKLGDKKAWEPRIKNGRDALVASVVKGKGAMPPKAGLASPTFPRMT